MKRQEELEAFRRFEATHSRAVWAQVLEARRRAEGSPNWQPNWTEGVRCQKEVGAILRAQWEESLGDTCFSTSAPKRAITVATQVRASNSFWPKSIALLW